MAVDQPKSLWKLEREPLEERRLRRLMRELITGYSEGSTPAAELVVLRELMCSEESYSIFRALNAEVTALRAKVSDVQSAADQLRADLAAQAVSHDIQSLEYRSRIFRVQAELARAQAENAALRRENDTVTEELYEARLQLGENDYEIGVLRRLLELPQRPSLDDLN